MEICIRPFNEGDVEFAYQMVADEQWNHSREDIERMFRLNRSGCFIAEVKGRPCGQVFTVFYGRLGWIGLLVVQTEYRRNRVGTLLMKRAMEHLLCRGAKTVKLEAVPEIADLYRKLGFVGEYDSLRFYGTRGEGFSAPNPKIECLKKNMLEDVAEFDQRFFGANREDLLRQLFNDYPELCFVSRSGSRISGYVLCRRADRGYRLGPWVCDPVNLQAAKDLLVRCIEVLGQNVEIFVGVPAVNSIAVGVLREHGFTQYSKSIRMRLGEDLRSEQVQGVFAVAGAEKG